MTTPPVTSRNTLWKTLLPAIVMIALVLGGLYFVKAFMVKPQPPGAVSREIRVGSTLPDFELMQFGGGSTKASQLKAKVTLVNFWATWCEACMIEMPSIIKLRKAYFEKGFDALLISVDDNPDIVLPKALKKFGINFPVYTDTDSKLSDLFDVRAVPLTVIMDRDRHILFIENGERDWDAKDVHAEVERWLGG